MPQTTKNIQVIQSSLRNNGVGRFNAAAKHIIVNA